MPNDQGEKGEKLTRKEEAFCAEYLRDLNATAAARRAGYKDGPALAVTAHRLLRRPRIRARLEQLRKEILTQRVLSAQEVLEQLSLIATADLADAFDAHGNLLPLRQMPANLRAAIAGLEVLIKNAAGGDGEQDVVHKVKLWDKVKALELLAKYHQLLVERVDVTVSGDAEVIAVLQAGRQRVAQLRQQAQGHLPPAPRVIDVSPAPSR